MTQAFHPTQEEIARLADLRTMLHYMRGDARIPDAFRWSFSIDAKLTAVGVMYTEVLQQLPKAVEEIETAKREGIGGVLQSTILALKYETFLNSIYAICENLSFVVFSLSGRKLPRHFREQKNKILSGVYDDKEYAKILEQTHWYNEIHSMRTEATHYLSGMITVSSPTELGYFNEPKSEKKDAAKNIQINDIQKHINDVYQNVLAFLASFGNHFVRIINPNVPVVDICYIQSGLICARLLSLRENLNNEAGTCHTPTAPCPNRKNCKALGANPS